MYVAKNVRSTCEGGQRDKENRASQNETAGHISQEGVGGTFAAVFLIVLKKEKNRGGRMMRTVLQTALSYCQQQYGETGEQGYLNLATAFQIMILDEVIQQDESEMN